MDGCIVPDQLIQPMDRERHETSGDPYLTTDYYPRLASFVAQQRPRAVLEIGVRFGYSLAVVLDSFPGIEIAYGIDLDDSPGDGGEFGAYAIARENLRQLLAGGHWPSLRHLRFLELNTQHIDRLPLEHAIDFAYIDGDHSAAGCLHDVEVVLPHLTDSGMIVADDADWAGLRPHVENWADAHGFAHEYIPDASIRGRIVIQVRGGLIEG